MSESVATCPWCGHVVQTQVVLRKPVEAQSPPVTSPTPKTPNTTNPQAASSPSKLQMLSKALEPWSKQITITQRQNQIVVQVQGFIADAKSFQELGDIIENYGGRYIRGAKKWEVPL